jgi:Haloacid dehalogenase-like hydrolase
MNSLRTSNKPGGATNRVQILPKGSKKSRDFTPDENCIVWLTTSSDDAEESKPAPDIFEVALKKLGVKGADAVAIGDTPYDAAAAGKAEIATIGVLCGGFTEASLRQAGCVQVYPGPAAILACFEDSRLAR